MGCYILVSLFFVIATMFEFAVVLVVKLSQEWKEKEVEACTGESSHINTLESTKRGIRRRNLVKSDRCDNLWETIEKQQIELKGERYEIGKYRGNWITSSRTNMIDFSSLFLFLFSYFVFNLCYFCHYMK